MTTIINDIQEDYCSFEVSKLLKEKGFGVPCNFYYYEKYYAEMLNKNRERLGLTERFQEGGIGKQLNKHWKGRLINRNQYDTTTSRPTHSLAIKWIRENFKYNIYTYTNGKIWHPCVQHLFGDIAVLSGKIGIYNTSEEATEAALLYTLQNLIL